MENTNVAVAARLKQWVEQTGLTKVDLAKKLEYPRTSLYAALNTGVISRELYLKILKHFPKTDMRWLINGNDEPVQQFQEPRLPYSRKEKTDNAINYFQKDLINAQLEVATQMKRIGDLLEKLLVSGPHKYPVADE